VVVVALQLLKFGVYRDCNCGLNVVAESLETQCCGCELFLKIVFTKGLR